MTPVRDVNLRFELNPSFLRDRNGLRLFKGLDLVMVDCDCNPRRRRCRSWCRSWCRCRRRCQRRVGVGKYVGSGVGGSVALGSCLAGDTVVFGVAMGDVVRNASAMFKYICGGVDVGVSPLS